MEVRVLGTLELVDGDSVIRLAPAERNLLAALASRSGERVSVDVLEEALWPEHRPPSARKTLQGHIARLRRVLGATSVVERGGTYRLDPDRVRVDADDVAALLADARDSMRGGRHDMAAVRLREARAACRGDPYTSVSPDALPPGEIQRLQELVVTVAEELFETDLARGNGHRCVGDLEAYATANPYRERAWCQLMLALYQAGRPADALATYSRARLLLATELGLEPGPALRELEQSILVHDPRLLTSTSMPTGLGPSNLPVALSTMVGREGELAALDRLVCGHRLVTLTGIGGIGKTRLAVEVAGRVAARGEFGPYFVDLTSVGAVDLVPAALAAALGVTVDRDDVVLERVRSALGSRAVLVVMDNCEHLLPGIAGMIAGLLASASGLRVVAASRESLCIAGERVWPVAPLGVPAADSAPDDVEESESGALFIACLPMSATSRALSVDEVRAVGSICRSLDGIPLGLELAAARGGTLSLPELAERLDRSIDELALPGHGRPPRHRTMRAALDWGYRLLSPRAQRSFRAMSVFAGGCDLPAFAATCLEDPSAEGLDVMDELVRTSFAVADLSGHPTRYRLLEPVRQFARELLDAHDETFDVRQGHLQFYAGLAEVLSAAVDGPGGVVPRASWLREIGNMRVALDWAAGDRAGRDDGLRLAADMYDVWEGSAHRAEGVARVISLLDGGEGAPSLRSRAASIAAIIAANAGANDEAMALAEQALREATRADDSAPARRARQILASLLANRGDLAAARRTLGPALPAGPEQVTDVDAFCLATQAEIDFLAGHLDAAAAAARSIVAGPFGAFGWVGTAARFMLSEVMRERGDLGEARQWLTQALSLAERLGDTLVEMDAHLDFVGIEGTAGRADEADVHLGLAADLRQDHDRQGDLSFLAARAALALCRQRPGDAVNLAEAAVGLAIDVGNASRRCENLRLLGDAQVAMGDAERALATHLELIERARTIPYPCRVADGHEGAAAACAALGQIGPARRHLADATRIRGQTGTRRLPWPAVEARLVELEDGGPTAVAPIAPG